MNFENLNKNTQKAKAFIDSFKSHKGYSIFDIYDKPSERKVSIFNELKKELENMGYYNISCVSGGTGYFSMAGEDSVSIVYITVAHNYRIEK